MVSLAVTHGSAQTHPMARTQRVSTGKGNDLVVINSPAPAPKRRRSGGGEPRRRSRRRGRRGRGRSSSVSLEKRISGGAAGGFLYGFVEKNFGDKIPTIPAIGKSGSIALAIYFLKPKNEHLRDIGFAAATIAGYSFAKTGTVSGGTGVHGYASEV